MGEFVQVVQGRVGDATALLGRLERWMEELRPGATGWLGSTGGVTEDGYGIFTARFESRDAARANSDRPEQGRWWAATEACFSGEVSFHDCEQVDAFLGGGSDDAGFVQVIQGRVRDIEAYRSQMQQVGDRLRSMRPDVIGGFCAWHSADEGAFTQVVYFRSEAEARVGEARRDASEDAPRWEELLDGAPAFYDIKRPRMWSH